jgi:hypothetical protein
LLDLLDRNFRRLRWRAFPLPFEDLLAGGHLVSGRRRRSGFRWLRYCLLAFEPVNFSFESAEAAGKFFHAVAGVDGAHNQPDGQGQRNSNYHQNNQRNQSFHKLSFLWLTRFD